MHIFLLVPILLTTQVMGSTINKEEMEMEEVETENLISSRDFKVEFQFRILSPTILLQGIVCGVLGFWACFFVMGAVYLLMVLAKRVFKPEEAEKSPS